MAGKAEGARDGARDTDSLETWRLARSGVQFPGDFARFLLNETAQVAA